MTGYGPPDDPSEAPTGLYDYSGAGDPPPPQGSGPWYRNRIILVAFGLFVAIMLGLMLYLFADQTGGQGGTTQTPTSPTTSSPTASTTTPTTAPAAPPEPTTTVEPATTAPTPTTRADDEHHHHHHHDWIPWP